MLVGRLVDQVVLAEEIGYGQVCRPALRKLRIPRSEQGFLDFRLPETIDRYLWGQ